MLICEDVEFSIDSLNIEFPEKDSTEELMSIVAAIPTIVWEDFGYEEITSIDTEWSMYGDGIIVHIHDKKGWSETTVYLDYNRNWQLAKKYKPYYDFCKKQIEKSIKTFSEKTDFIAYSPDPKFEVLETLRFCNKNNMYDTYFVKFELEDDFVKYCIDNNIRDLKNITELKYKWVFQNLFTTINDVTSEKFSKHRFFMQELGYISPKKFCIDFLSQNYDIDDLKLKVESLITYLKDCFGSKKFWIMEVMGTLTALKRKIINKFDNNDVFLDMYAKGFCEGYIEARYCICIKKDSSVDDLVELLNLDESSREVIEYFKNTADFYQKKNSVPFHLSGYQVISKKSKYSDDVLFTASIKNLDLYCDGVTEEQAIKKLEEEYSKNLSYKLLDNIMNDYPITIGTKSS